MPYAGLIVRLARPPGRHCVGLLVARGADKRSHAISFQNSAARTLFLFRISPRGNDFFCVMVETDETGEAGETGILGIL